MAGIVFSLGGNSHFTMALDLGEPGLFPSQNYKNVSVKLNTLCKTLTFLVDETS
jgi:hypothetical protein